MIVKCAALFAFASALSAPFAMAKERKMRLRNLTFLQPFSPVVFVAHANNVSFFNEGLPASDALRLMAEDGNNSALIAEIQASPFVCGYVAGDAPLFPGETWRGTLEVDEEICPNPQYTMAAMLINTNDAFVGIDSDNLSGGPIKTMPPAFDAGTEMNNELCTHIPGPACANDTGNMQDVPTDEGYVHIHRGFHGVTEMLRADRYDWRNPVAEVFIFEE